MAKRQTFTFSDDLLAAMQLLRKRRKYRTLSEYVAALARYDGLTQREHRLTADWASLSPAERDLLDASILKKVEDETATQGSWLEALIEDVVKKHVASHDGHPPSTKEVAQKVAEEIVKST